MNSQIGIRQATIDNARVLTDLAYTTFRDAFADHPKNAPDDLKQYMLQAFNVEQISAELADENTIFLIAEFEGEPAGYAKLITGVSEDAITAARPIELNRLYAHQRFLGKGIGQALMDECFLLAQKGGFDVMWLGVWEFNPRAQRFYEKNGFRFIGSHVFMLGSDPQTDLLMQREL